jgi:CubicO group peptidase (beta-lactamase class C family)
MAIGYNDKSTPADRPILFAGDSDSGLYSTVEDLYRWDQAMYSEKLVSQKSLDAIFTAYIPSPMIGPGTQYGYGWIVYTFGKQNWFAIPSFMTPGYQTDIDRQLNDKITIIILSNQWDVGAHDIVERIQAIGFGQ